MTITTYLFLTTQGVLRACEPAAQILSEAEGSANSFVMRYSGLKPFAMRYVQTDCPVNPLFSDCRGGRVVLLRSNA